MCYVRKKVNNGDGDTSLLSSISPSRVSFHRCCSVVRTSGWDWVVVIIDKIHAFPSNDHVGLPFALSGKKWGFGVFKVINFKKLLDKY